jgi:uncharacterized ion transporter superfamily protein YfcC
MLWAYRLFYPDFLKVEYVLRAFFWIVLTAATYIYLYYLTRGIKNRTASGCGDETNAAQAAM